MVVVRTKVSCLARERNLPCKKLTGQSHQSPLPLPLSHQHTPTRHVAHHTLERDRRQTSLNCRANSMVSPAHRLHTSLRPYGGAPRMAPRRHRHGHRTLYRVHDSGVDSSSTVVVVVVARKSMSNHPLSHTLARTPEASLLVGLSSAHARRSDAPHELRAPPVIHPGPLLSM